MTLPPRPSSPRTHEKLRRINRRSFLAASAAISAAAAGAAVVGYTRSGKPGKTNGVLAESATPAALPVGTRGGTLLVYNFDAMISDSLDPHLTQMGPIANMHSAVFSKLLRYENESSGVMAPDLAAAMPEQPDQLTYVIRLRDGVTFHDTPKFRSAHPKTSGRPLTADDVKYSIQRQLNTASPQSSLFFRRSNWSVIDKIDVRDPLTLIITTKTPVAPFLNFLAGRHAFIIPAGIAGRADDLANDAAMIGTGPFVLDSFEEQSAVKLVRNPTWFARDDNPRGAGASRPFLDGYTAYFSPQEDAFQRAAFERRAVDATGFADVATLDDERKTNLEDIVLDETGAGGVVASRFLLDRKPFNDDRVRRAIHLAIDRAALIDALYPPMDGRPSAQLSGPIAPVMGRFAIAPDDLAHRAGYRADAAGRADDIRTAKQLWQAATGDTVTELRISIAGLPKEFPARAIDLLTRQLSGVLGANVTTLTDPTGQALISAALVRNVEGATDGVAPFTFAFEDGGVDLDDWLYPQFHSDQTMNSYRLQDAQVDTLLDKSRAEFDAGERQSIGLDVQDYLIAKANARLEFCASIRRQLRWGYIRNSTLPMLYGHDEALADVWLDTTHPAWRPR
jgi:peptide/nickel transport system substrate-binding protein